MVLALITDKLHYAMALPSVSVEIKKGGLGRVAGGDDRVCALLLNALADRPLQIFSAREAESHAAGATAYGEEYMRQIRDFYSVAGEGAELWVLPVNPALTTTEIFTNGLLADLQEISGGRVSVVAISRWTPIVTSAITEGLATDVVAALGAGQTFLNSQASQNKPMRVLLDGYAYSGDVSALKNLRLLTSNRIGVCVGSNKAGARNAAMGLLLGRIAATAPQVNLGRVKDGPVTTGQAYLTSSAVVDSLLSSLTLGQLHDKGYIFLRKHYGRGGYYWNDDPMATLITDDYFSLSNGRVIDKAHRIAYATFLDDLLDNVLVDEVTGLIVASTLKYYQGRIERAIDVNMTNTGEISGCTAFVDPKQDVLGTGVLNVDLNIVPVGTNRAIKVRLGLVNPSIQ